MMNLRHIEVFHAVYVNGSVSGAARALNVSQPSISKVLRHAEIRLGFLLFERAKGRLTATDEAHALFREVDEIYDRVGSLQQTAKNIRRGGDGHIRIAVLPGFGLGVAPNAVAEFRAQHPNVSFDIQTVHHSDILRTLHERHCDLAIGYEPPRHPRLAHTQIGESELVLLYRRKDLPDAPARLKLDILEGREFVSLAHSGPMGNLFNKEVARLNLKLTEAVTISTLYVAAPLVRQGVGMAVVDDFTARACLDPELDYRPLDPALRFGVHCIYLADRPIPRLMQPFIKVLSALTTNPSLSQETSPASAATALRLVSG
jgi:DNA-binding transcriptional LysR family regulator